MDQQLRNLVENAKKSKGYMICVTFLEEDAALRNFTISKDFPRLDMLPSIAEFRKMAIEDLENLRYSEPTAVPIRPDIADKISVNSEISLPEEEPEEEILEEQSSACKGDLSEDS